MGIAVQIQSYVMVTTDYKPETWHAFVVSFKFYSNSASANAVFQICIFCMTCWILVNIFAVKSLHYMNSTGTFEATRA